MAVKRRIYPRIRIMLGADIALGPGKADLLEAIAKTGSLSGAAEQMGMSYMRAWTLLKTMNCCFRTPLATLARGGKQGGGAELTETGRRVVVLYRRMESASVAAMQPALKQLLKSLKS